MTEKELRKQRLVESKLRTRIIQNKTTKVQATSGVVRSWHGSKFDKHALLKLGFYDTYRR